MTVARILVAGGTGSLGRAIVQVLKTTDHQVRVQSQRASPAFMDSDIEWVLADVTSGEGLADALSGVDMIVNCLGSYQKVYEVDVLGVKRLAEMAKAAGVSHFFHISIAGIDRVDYEFYRHKQAAEVHVINSGVPYSIQRVTQFHTFIFYLMSQSVQLTPYLLPTVHDALFQPIDTRDVAAYTLPFILDRPAGRLADVGGPEILRVDEMAHDFLAMRGVDAPLFMDPPQGFFPESALPALRRGVHTVPKRRYGQITWFDYLQSTLLERP